jgi:8-oxo-dGTP diphosphatase
MQSKENSTRVGVGLLLTKKNKILLGQRKGAHGEGEYGAVGGHLEYLEPLEEAILRELAEECGTNIKIQDLRLLCVINLRHYRPKHYVDIGFAAELVSGEPKIMEPHKVKDWQWYDIDNLPSPLFVTEPLYIEAMKTGKIYFEY